MAGLVVNVYVHSVLYNTENIYFLEQGKSSHPVAEISIGSIWENKEIKIEVIEVNGQSCNISKTKIVSVYYITNSEGRPFTPERDGYSFKIYSLDKGTITDWLATLGISDGLFRLILQLQAEWNGICFGMSTTSGLYFTNPELIPSVVSHK